MKRLVVLLLSVALLIAFIPVGALQVHAEVFDASDDCIKILKQLEGFCSKPIWDYGQWSVGYGTACPPEDLERYKQDGIPEEEAEALLRKYVVGMGGAINNFAAKNNLNLTQNQFDALLLFTYNCGTGWMSESSGMFYNAVVNGRTGNEFIFPIVRWCVAGDSILDGLVRRRLSEANIYLNGEYSTTPPTNYCYVKYDANGGSTPYRIQGYDSDLTASIIPTPSRDGYMFDGWYTARTDGTKVTVLDAGTRNRTLYARWIGTDGKPAAPSNIGTAITPVEVTVLRDDVNLREGPGTDYDIVGSANKGKKFTITATATGNGYNWGKFDGGWIALTYTDFDTAGSNDNSNTTTPTTSVMGTVTSDDGLRIRSGAGTNYAIVGFLDYNERVEILDKTTVSGTPWGKISNGWICLNYVKLDDASDSSQTPETTPTEPAPTEPAPTEPAPTEPAPTEPAPTEPVETTPEKKTGTVTGSDLRIRSGAGTSYPVVGYLDKGDKVEILEQKTVGGMVWGKISNGWISMNYVKLDTAETSAPTTPSEPEPAEPAPEQKPASGDTGKVVYTNSLRIRSGPGTTYSVLGYLTGGTEVLITQRTTTDGMEWGKISSGWISLDYVQFDSDSSGDTVSGTVIADDFLRIRSGAGTSYSIAGYLDSGDHVEISERKTVNGTEWGRISKGWICMDYIRLDGQSSASGSGSTSTSTNSKTVIADCLCVRSDAGTNNAVVSYLYYGQKVTVTETKTVSGMTWGKISNGWISMDYVK